VRTLRYAARAPEEACGGHNTSRKRVASPRIERHVVERCPDCHYRLTGESLDYRRAVIEWPPSQPVAVTLALHASASVEYQVIQRGCPCCGRWRSPRLD
jgi:hypothetical protein